MEVKVTSYTLVVNATIWVEECAFKQVVVTTITDVIFADNRYNPSII
jgi:hypothetical protein